MTDVSKLDDQARAISASYSKIRAYAIAQAAATQAQEADLKRIWEEIILLKGSGTGTRPAPAPGNPPPANTFGALLPARIAESTGSIYNVSTKALLEARLADVPNGSIINITASINGGGTLMNITRNASAAAPITITRSAGVLLTNFSQIVLKGQYIRMRGLDIGYATNDNIKIDGSANFVEIDGCLIHDSARMGINVQASPQNVQLWNNIIYLNGSIANGALDHGIYFAYARGACVIANNLLYENCAYNIQVYPDASNIIITNNTVDDGIVHAGNRGGMVIGSESGTTDNTRTYGCLFTNAPWYGIDIYNPSGGDSGNQAFDCLGFGNGLGNFRTDGGMTYVRCASGNPLYINAAIRNYKLQAGSPAINYIDAARYGYVPPLDIEGNARVTADAGCYRYV